MVPSELMVNFCKEPEAYPFWLVTATLEFPASCVSAEKSTVGVEVVEKPTKGGGKFVAEGENFEVSCVVEPLTVLTCPVFEKPTLTLFKRVIRVPEVLLGVVAVTS